MGEIWKDIYYEDKGKIYDYRGYYQVSNYGRIKSLERYDNMNRLVKEKILKLNKNKRGKYNHNKEEYIKTHKIINKTNKGFTFYYKEDFKECEE